MYHAMEHAKRGRVGGHIDRVRNSPRPTLFYSSTHIDDGGETDTYWDMDLSSNPHRIAIFTLAYRGGVGATSVSLDGVACTKFNVMWTGDAAIEIWYMLEASLPVAGTYEIEVISNGSQCHHFCAMCWDDTLRIGDWDRNNAYGGTPSVTMVVEPGDVGLSFVGLQSTYIISGTSSQIVVTSDNTASNSAAVGYKQAVSTSITIDWSFGPEWYVTLGIVLKKLNNPGPTIKLLSIVSGTQVTADFAWRHLTTETYFSNRALFVFFAYGTTGTVPDIYTYNGVTMTLLGGYTYGNCKVYIFYKINPPMGDYDVYIHVVGGVNAWASFASVLFCGVHQTTAPNIDGSAGMTLGSNSETFTLSAEDALASVLSYWDDAEAATPNSGQDEIFNLADTSWKGMCHWKKGVGSTTVGYSNLDHESALAVVHIHAA